MHFPVGLTLLSLQKHELGALQAQLNDLKGENFHLLRNLKKVKDAAREGQERSRVMYVYVQTLFAMR